MPNRRKSINKIREVIRLVMETGLSHRQTYRVLSTFFSIFCQKDANFQGRIMLIVSLSALRSKRQHGEGCPIGRGEAEIFQDGE
jgi:hypothetical protein